MGWLLRVWMLGGGMLLGRRRWILYDRSVVLGGLGGRIGNRTEPRYRELVRTIRLQGFGLTVILLFQAVSAPCAVACVDSLLFLPLLGVVVGGGEVKMARS